MASIIKTKGVLKGIIYIYCLLVPVMVIAQPKTDRLIVITTDGFRWQELFSGMDSGIANQRKFNQNDSAGIFKRYWSTNREQRRKLLMPFFWNTLVQQGQVYGNRNYGNYVNTANPYRFSYPGYNEIFTGYPDTAVNSNDYPPNPNVTVLEFLHQQPPFKGKIAAFTAWEAFNRILNEGRSGIPVIAAFDTITGTALTAQQQLINKMLLNSYKPWNEAECLDVFTHYAAMEYLKTSKPKVVYIAYGETDEWAHAGQYKNYLNAAHQLDRWLKEIWDYIQTTPEYKNKTAMIVTVDHGRGRTNDWTDHGKDVSGADEIWFTVIAPGLPSKGEVKESRQLYQQQLAQTLTQLLGTEFKTDHPVAEGLMNVLKK